MTNTCSRMSCQLNPKKLLAGTLLSNSHCESTSDGQLAEQSHSCQQIVFKDNFGIFSNKISIFFFLLWAQRRLWLYVVPAYSSQLCLFLN